MARIKKKRPNTRLAIIRLAAKLFIEEGYSNTSAKRIAAALDLSPGNLTFYFPTKDHLLAVIVNELCDFQRLLMEHASEEGKSSLLASVMVGVMRSAFSFWLTASNFLR